MSGLLALVGFVGILMGLVNLVYPIRHLQITSRKMAAAILGVSFVAFMVGGLMLPQSGTDSRPQKNGAALQAPGVASQQQTAPEEKPDTRPEAEPEIEPETQPEAEPETKPQGAPETQAAAPTPAPPQTETVLVVSVADGDTIKVSMNGKTETVRLIGVDTPETVHPSKPIEPYGPEASAYTKRRLSGQNVRLEFDVEERDRYGRLLAYVWLGNELFNATLVRDGYGMVLTIPPNVKHADLFVALQREARENNRGLWGLDPTAGQSTPAPVPAPPGTSTYYKSCTAAREAGAAPLYRGQPGYGTHLDRDGDGVACE